MQITYNTLEARVGSPDLTSVPGEPETIQRLLGTVTVEGGVARGYDQLSATAMHLAAVRIVDGEAVRAPLAQTEGGALELALPADTSTRIGFFIGYSGRWATDLAVRARENGGAWPLATSSPPLREMLGQVAGIKQSEPAERQWAEQVGLYTDLEFDPARSRGFFSIVHYDTEDPDTLHRWPIDAVDEVDDHTENEPGPSDAETDGGLTMQFLGYTAQSLPSIGASDERSPSSFGGLKIRPGLAYMSAAEVSRGDEPKHLIGAFEVKIVPQS
jgi:hypothetical protein